MDIHSRAEWRKIYRTLPDGLGPVDASKIDTDWMRRKKLRYDAATSRWVDPMGNTYFKDELKLRKVEKEELPEPPETQYAPPTEAYNFTRYYADEAPGFKPDIADPLPVIQSGLPPELLPQITAAPPPTAAELMRQMIKTPFVQAALAAGPVNLGQSLKDPCDDTETMQQVQMPGQGDGPPVSVMQVPGFDDKGRYKYVDYGVPKPATDRERSGATPGRRPDKPLETAGEKRDRTSPDPRAMRDKVTDKSDVLRKEVTDKSALRDFGKGPYSVVR